MEEDWRENYAYTLGVQAYLWGYPWLYMPQAIWNRTTGRDTKANEWFHDRNLVTSEQQIGGQPNNDIVYSQAWAYLDEPIILSVPAIEDRYCTMELCNYYGDNFDYVGTRTTGDWPAAGAQMMVGLVANDPEEAMYINISLDSVGAPLKGVDQYECRFENEDPLPLVHEGGFWSLTMYDMDFNLVDNPIDRYSVGDRSNLQADADGSITLYVSAGSPGAEKESNWLPAPDAEFNMLMRIYWPEESVLDGTWEPPPLIRRA
jgi:hypothetical protein